MIAYIPGFILGALTAWGVWKNREYRRAQKTLLYVTLAVYLVSFQLAVLGMHSSLLSAVFTILVLGLMAIFLASLKERYLFQTFLLLLGLRFLILYFQALGGLATTGVGLIISGGLVIAMAVLWNKYRARIALWAERTVQ